MIYLPNFLLVIPRNPVVALGLPLALGTLSGYKTAEIARSRWYQGLNAPPGRPPRQAFPIVWPILYLSMGYASHLAVKALDNSVSLASRSSLSLGLALYYTQLALNVAWTPLFFNAKRIGIALIDSILLAGTTFYMTRILHSGTAGATTIFLLPYCGWLSFATYLNGGIWWLNRESEQQE